MKLLPATFHRSILSLAAVVAVLGQNPADAAVAAAAVEGDNNGRNAHPNDADQCQTTSAPGEASAEPDYLIVGGGGSGIQMALFLEKYKYSCTILEKEDVAGSFWTRFPVFRELISVNKWTRNETHRLRYDWHSMLDAPLQMMDVTDDYFPTGTDWHRYMSLVAEHANLNIEYGVEVESILSSDVGSKPCVMTTDGTKLCARRRIFVGTGLREKHEPLLEALGGIPYSRMTKSAARRKRVCIFGNGNAGFEVAQNVFNIADRVTVYGKDPFRLSSVTKYVGNVRVKFLQVLENFHGKLLDTVEHSETPLRLPGLERRYDSSQIDAVNNVLNTASIIRRDECETTVIATGFRSHVPGKNLTSRFPGAKKWYESTEDPQVHYIGWLMHEADFRKSAGGFLAGYRYLIRNLVDHVRFEDDEVSYPRLTLTKDEVIGHVIARFQTASDLVILQDGVVLRDVIVPAVADGDNDLYYYYEGATYQFHDEFVGRDGVIYAYFMWGNGRRAQDVFDNVNLFSDEKFLRNNLIHPAIEVNGLVREIEEDIRIEWASDIHVEAVETTIRAALEGNMTLFRPEREYSYERAIVNATEPKHKSYESGERQKKNYVDSGFMSAMFKSVRSGFAVEDLQALTTAAMNWVPSMFS